MRITGLGNVQFGEATVAMLSIHQLFSKMLVKGTMLVWEVKREQEHIVLDFHSQYLSLREKTISSAIIDIPKYWLQRASERFQRPKLSSMKSDKIYRTKLHT